jgi:hypothetical protein
MSTRPRHPANSRVGDLQAAAAAGGDFITGRRRIAHALGLSERQTSRLISRGALPATRAPNMPNRPLAVRSADIGKVR